MISQISSAFLSGPHLKIEFYIYLAHWLPPPLAGEGLPSILGDAHRFPVWAQGMVESLLKDWGWQIFSPLALKRIFC
jgi:hypothetical protein